MIKQTDILIIGGGLIGASLTLALANQGYKTLLVEAKPFEEMNSKGFDVRTLALSPSSMRILEMLGIGSLIKSDITPIDTIHVSSQHHFGTTRLNRKPEEALGYVIELPSVYRALTQLLDQEALLTSTSLVALDTVNRRVSLTNPNGPLTIEAKLIVAADGADSTIRRMAGLKVNLKDYNQHAIVANIGLARSHKNHAYERFTKTGPLALLPMSHQRAALVWSLNPEEAAKTMALNESQFLAKLQTTFGYRLGRFTQVGQRMVYPLRQYIMPQALAWPIVFVGNAVHTLHPVAGQGFNLGLRDIAMLAQCIVQHGLNEAMLHTYHSLRQADQSAIIRLTDSLISIFGSRILGGSLIRNLGLIAMDNLTLLKNHLTFCTQGFAGITPDLVCGIPLLKRFEEQEG